MTNITQQHKLAGLIVTTAFVVGVGFTTVSSSQTACTEQNNQLECQQQQSWLSWLKGHSRSSQFHFVDFLELLDRVLPSSSGPHDG